MKNILKILKFEYLTCIRNKAFIIITVFMVCASMLFSLIPGIMQSMSEDDASSDESSRQVIAITKSGYDDELIRKEFSPYYPAADITITDEQRKVIEEKVDSGEYLFAVDITAPNSFTYITKNQTLYNADDQIVMKLMQDMYSVTELNKLGISGEQADKILHAGFFSEVVTTGADITKNYMPVYLLMCILFVSITFYGQLVTQSVVSEKNTRAMELLITCAKPSELMFGKVIGAGLAGLTQLAVIFLSLACSINLAPWGEIPPEIKEFISFPTETLLLALVFFLLGFFIYAFLLGALASFASKSEDLNGLTTPVLFVMMGVYFAVVFLCTGDMIDSTAMTVLSYIPLSAPMAMFVRATLIDIPVWEIAVSVVLQMITIYLCGLLAAAIYKIGVLMYGNPPRFSEIIRLLKKQ